MSDAPFSLRDKVILVTGAASGIGRASALILARAGAKVAAAGRSTGPTDTLVEEIKGSGGDALAVAADISVESEVVAMVDATVARFGRLDGAFNNAGVEMNNKLTPDLSADEWDHVFDVDVRGMFLCMKYEMAAMRRHGGGAIVNNSSMNGLVAIENAAEYVSAKHAVCGLTRGASSEAAKTGVRVNAVLPGLIETPMIERLSDEPGFQDHLAGALARHSVGRFGKPEDVAYAVHWLLSDEASFVNGAMIAVDGGYTAR